MLDGFRKHSNSIVVKGLLFLLIASFAAWGIGDMLRPAATGNAVATVDGVEVSSQEVYNDFQREMARMRQLTGDQGVDENMTKAIGGSVVDRAVNRTLLAVNADDMNVAVSDEQVARDIRNTEMFQEDGKFSRARFEQVLFSNRLTEDQFIEMVRGDLAREQVLSVLTGGITAPRSAAKDVYAYRQEKRSADVVTIGLDSVGQVGEPTEEEIRKYYQDNIDSFMAPEYRGVTLLHITPQEVAKSLDVPLEKLEDAYTARQSELKKPARRTVEQVVFATEQDAKQAAEKLAAGTAFAEVSDDVLSLGDVTREDLPEELRDVTFALSEGGVSAPVKSILGWHIVHVTEATKAVDPSFDEVKDELRQSVALEMAGEEVYALSNQVEDVLGGGATIEEAAKEIGFELVKVESTDDRGNAKDYKKVDALRGKKLILQDIFQMDMDAEPMMKDDGEGGYYVVRIDNVTSSKARPFDDVKLAVKSFVTDMKKYDLAEEKAKALIEKIKGGTPLAQAAQEANLVLTTEKNFTRTNAALPQDVVKALFDAEVGESAIGAARDGQIVAVLKEIKSMDGEADQSQIEGLRADLSTAISNDLQSQFVNALRSRYNVEIDRAMVNRLFVTETQ